MAEYNPKNIDAFLAAINADGATVNCPDGAVWQVPTWYSRTQYRVRCAEINGNGTTIKGLKVSNFQFHPDKTEAQTDVYDLTLQNLDVSGSVISASYSGISPVLRLNLTRCKISAEFGSNLTKFFSQPNVLAAALYVRCSACSLNVNAYSGSYELGNGCNLFCEYCNVDFNAPNVTNGMAALTGFYHLEAGEPINEYHKCQIYLYMPMWNGYWETQGEHGINLLEGSQFLSCTIYGNLSSLRGSDGKSYLATTTQDVTVFAANTADGFYDGSAYQLRQMTVKEARDATELLSPTMITHVHFDLVTENPSDTDWQIDKKVNGGLPFIACMPDLIRVESVPQKKKRLRIYDMMTPQSDLKYNGIAMLDAVEAPVHEVLNGEYTLTFTHPMDKLGKWKYIKESNIVKCQGQLFTIVQCVWNYTGKNAGEITATCEQMFYQNNDHWIYPKDTPLQALYTCKAAMDAIMGATTDYDDSTMNRYTFEWDSDWEFAVPFFLTENNSGCTPVNALLGGNGLIGMMGGELYRDNFYFSINQTMEGSKENAFDIRFGANMSGITRTVDASSMCTHFTLYDTKSDSWWAVSYANDGFPLFQFPHTVARSQEYTFTDAAYEAIDAGDADIITMLSQVGMNIWLSSCTPILCYDVSLVDIEHTVLGDKILKQEYRVGDSGRIHDEVLGVDVTIKITEIEMDGITGQSTRVVFGSKNSLTRAAGYPKFFEGSTSPTQTVVSRLMDKNRKKLTDKNGKKIMRKDVF